MIDVDVDKTNGHLRLIVSYIQIKDVKYLINEVRKTAHTFHYWNIEHWLKTTLGLHWMRLIITERSSTFWMLIWMDHVQCMLDIHEQSNAFQFIFQIVKDVEERMLEVSFVGQRMAFLVCPRLVWKKGRWWRSTLTLWKILWHLINNQYYWIFFFGEECQMLWPCILHFQWNWNCHSFVCGTNNTKNACVWEWNWAWHEVYSKQKLIFICAQWNICAMRSLDIGMHQSTHPIEEVVSHFGFLSFPTQSFSHIFIPNVGWEPQCNEFKFSMHIQTFPNQPSCTHACTPLTHP